MALTIGITSRTSVSGGSGSSSTGSGAYGLVEHGTSDTTFTLTSNTFHVWDEIPELTLTFSEETPNVANEYLFQFTSGAEPTVLTLPTDVIWANDEIPIIESNYVYQISILKGFATYMKFTKKIYLIIYEEVYDSISGDYVDSISHILDIGQNTTWEELCLNNADINEKYEIIINGVNEISVYDKEYNREVSLRKYNLEDETATYVYYNELINTDITKILYYFDNDTY